MCFSTSPCTITVQLESLNLTSEKGYVLKIDTYKEGKKAISQFFFMQQNLCPNIKARN